jgi:hypothetical protein
MPNLDRSAGRRRFPVQSRHDAGVLRFIARDDERGVALLLALLVLALLVALILEFDTDARREYRDAAAFRDNFKATVLTRAAVQAARAVLQQDHLRDRQTGQAYDATTDLWAFPIEKYAIGDGLMTAQIEDERSKLNLNDLAAGVDPNVKKTKMLRLKRLSIPISLMPLPIGSMPTTFLKRPGLRPSIISRFDLLIGRPTLRCKRCAKSG